MLDNLTWIIALSAFGSFLAGWQSRVWAWRLDRRSPSRTKRADVRPIAFAADQLKVVMTATFSPRPILSAGERRVFEAAERSLAELQPAWRVAPQVCLGEVLKASDATAFSMVNSKRVDMLIVDGAGMPKAAIEYQGAGHHQGSAAARDAVKREALRRAGVAYIEVLPGERPSALHAAIARLATPAAATAAA